MESNTNRELFATDNQQIMDVFADQLSKIEDKSLQAFLQKIEPAITPYEGGGLLLTDDKAPVELLGMQVIDGIIEDEVGYYKEIFREKGIDGVMELIN